MLPPTPIHRASVGKYEQTPLARQLRRRSVAVTEPASPVGGRVAVPDS